MKNILILFSAIGLFACSTSTSTNEIKLFEVEYYGALKNMMHKGDISSKVALKEFENTAHLYAIGAFENLKGEIQIFDGEPFNTFVKDSALNFDNGFTKNATLLVYAEVSEWQDIEIPSSIITYEELEAFVGEMAKKNKIDTDKPFPFLIEGTLNTFDWHVINWKDGDTEHSHEKHIQSGLHGTITNSAVDLLGFYSNAHHAIFTHHTTNMHIHVKTKDNKIAGHVDALILGEGMVLKLPVVE